MSITKYSYNKLCDSNRLEKEILESLITIVLDHIETKSSPETTDVFFKAALPTNEETELTTIIDNHVNTPLPDETPTFKIDQPKDSDGSPLQRLKVTTAGWALNYHCMELTTSSLTSIDKDENNEDFNFLAVKLYNSENQLITEQENVGNCVKTVIDWEPNFDYDIIGGDVLQITSPASDIRVSVIGVPDISAQYGGSKIFMSGFNLKYLSDKKLTIDGKTPKALKYNANLHTNKLRFVFHHNAGISHTIHLTLMIFKA